MSSRILVILCLMISSGCFARESIFTCESNPPIELNFPVSCQLEENCWLINYPDLDSSEKAKDYKGKNITYNGNKGIDIAVKTYLELKNGISVLASQDGKVVDVRNNIEDNYPFGPKNDDVKPPFCGNFVVIEHNHGWKTAYCHLKKDSITVKPGDFTSKGKKVAEVGLSGQTEFPHLYFAVFQDEKYFDPFSGKELGAENPKSEYRPFWNPITREKLEYRDVILVNTGVSIEDPTLYSIRQGKYKDIEIMQDEPEIFIWAHGFHFEKNDLIKITLRSPRQKTVMEDYIKVNSGKMEDIVSFKVEKEDKTWVPGFYTVKINYLKPDLKLLYTYDFNFEIKSPPEPVDEEKEAREKLLKKLKLQRRKVIIFHKLKQDDKLPDTYKENKFEYGK